MFVISSLPISRWRHHASEGSLQHAAAVAVLPTLNATSHGVQQPGQPV